MSRGLLFCLSLFFVAFSAGASQVEDLRAEFEKLRKDFDKPGSNAAIGRTEQTLESRYGPNAKVSTKDGKLQISGLIQVWFTAMQDDPRGIIQPAPGNNLGLSEPNAVNDASTFRIRRTELRFAMDITENVLGYVMIDPSRESNLMFTPIPTFPQHNAVFTNPSLATGAGSQAGASGLTFGSSLGNTIIPQLLQDAYINYHDVVPHHDFTIGQFKPPTGEEANRNSGQLDFVERAMCTGITNVRDIGAMVHGTWFDNRFQYWFGAFDGPVGTILSDPEIVEGGNRSSTQNDKDFAWRIAGRPIWSTEKWYGRLEVGYHRTDGHHGSSGQAFDPSLAINGMNRQKTYVNRQGAWGWYRPNGPVRGWWFRGEWSMFHDRPGADPRFATDLLGTGGVTDANGAPLNQLNPAPINQQGWYFASGYRISDSRFADHFKNGCSWTRFMYDIEFAFRYEVFQNILAESPSSPDRNTNLYKTQAFTGGINYYIKKWDARIQLNGIVVDDPSVKNLGIREIRNNLLVASFQVMF